MRVVNLMDRPDMQRATFRLAESQRPAQQRDSAKTGQRRPHGHPCATAQCFSGLKHPFRDAPIDARPPTPGVGTTRRTAVPRDKWSTRL